MNRREALSFFAALPVVAGTSATIPTKKECLYLAAGIGMCEGVFDNDTPDADAIHRLCKPMVERGWMRALRSETYVASTYQTTPLGEQMLKACRALDPNEIARVRKGTSVPWARARA